LRARENSEQALYCRFVCKVHHTICMACKGVEIPSVVSAFSGFMPISLMMVVQIHLLN